MRWGEKQQDRAKILAGGYTITPDVSFFLQYTIDYASRCLLLGVASALKVFCFGTSLVWENPHIRNYSPGCLN